LRHKLQRKLRRRLVCNAHRNACGGGLIFGLEWRLFRRGEMYGCVECGHRRGRRFLRAGYGNGVRGGTWDGYCYQHSGGNQLRPKLQRDFCFGYIGDTDCDSGRQLQFRWVVGGLHGHGSL